MAEVEFEGFGHALEGLQSGTYILFKADWCGDCRRSRNEVEQAVAAAGQPLLVVDVARQPPGALLRNRRLNYRMLGWAAPRDAAWKTPDHPLRKDPRFQLGGVPTLALWRDGGVAAKLGAELEKAPDGEAARRVVAAFVEQHSA